jgi:hypothetical protein
MEERPINLNFFGWIRDGVKQSVLLGVGDAIDQLGTPAEAGDASPQVLAFLRSDSPVGRITQTESEPAGPGKSNRKRLGRSLKELEGTE